MVLEDKQGRQQAHLAAIRNHRNVLEFLYEKGVELDCPCNLGKLPLHYAAQHGCEYSFKRISNWSFLSISCVYLIPNFSIYSFR